MLTAPSCMIFTITVAPLRIQTQYLSNSRLGHQNLHIYEFPHNNNN